MRIGWFAPFAAGTAIGAFSAGVAEALTALGHDVLIVRIDDAGPAQPYAGEVTAWRFWPYFHDLDLRIYNFGDDFSAFAPAYDLIRRRPGLALLHAATLTGYFAERAAVLGGGEAPLDATGSLERVTVAASGAVVLSGEAAARAIDGCGVPVLTIPDGVCDPASIAAQLVRFLEELVAVEPLLRLSAQIAEVADDLALAPDDPAIRRIGAVARSLFPQSMSA